MTLSSYNPCAQRFRGNQQLTQSFFFLFAEQLGAKNKTLLHQTADKQKSEYIRYLLRAFLYLMSTAEPKGVKMFLAIRQWGGGLSNNSWRALSVLLGKVGRRSKEDANVF